MQRYCFALDLKDDPALIAEYERWHAPGAPPGEVTRAIRGVGIERLEIFRTGNRLIMLMEVSPAFSAEAMAAEGARNTAVQDWERRMWAFQQALPWAAPGQKWVPAAKIYDLEEQP